MNCKNCRTELTENSKFCNLCGAKVVTQRLTVKSLWADVTENVLGWDNKYFVTLKSLILKPGVLLKEYLEGTRKKYVNPFTFLVIGLTVTLFTFNSFDEQYIRSNSDFQNKQIQWQSQWMNETFGLALPSEEMQKKQIEDSEKSTKFMLKYFNILVVITLPLYSLLAFLVYRKPYNYGEHIVINSYIQGVSFISISILFLISLVTHPLVYVSNIVLLFIFYTYAYGKLYTLSIGQSIFKVFLFFSILLIFVIALLIMAFIIGIAAAYLGEKFG